MIPCAILVREHEGSCFYSCLSSSLTAGGGRIVALLPDRYATLAQLVEQQFCKLWVVGSNPTGGSGMLGR